jgi:hypothetical protein
MLCPHEKHWRPVSDRDDHFISSRELLKTFVDEASQTQVWSPPTPLHLWSSSASSS